MRAERKFEIQVICAPSGSAAPSCGKALPFRARPQVLFPG